LTETLRGWARGMHTTEAGTELLLRFAGGRFARLSQPWVVQEGAAVWVNAQALVDNLGPLSGGERRVLAIVASLLDAAHTVSLGDVLPGLDREALDLVLAALAHAAGSHQQNGVEVDDNGLPVAFPQLPSLHPWPV
jgi:hypothetical protein